MKVLKNREKYFVVYEQCSKKLFIKNLQKNIFFLNEVMKIYYFNAFIFMRW